MQKIYQQTRLHLSLNIDYIFLKQYFLVPMFYNQFTGGEKKKVGGPVAWSK